MEAALAVSMAIALAVLEPDIVQSVSLVHTTEQMNARL
jgi:hypothetical protein